MKSIDVAFIADRNMEVGLHVALASLSTHLADGFVAKCHLFLDDIIGERRESLVRTAQRGKDNLALYFYDLDFSELEGVRGLHFSLAPLKILKIPELIDARIFVYLDADVIVLDDLSPLADIPQTRAVGACATTTVSKCWIKERRLLERAGIAGEELYYNTGVMLIDCRRWIEQSLPRRWQNFIEQFGSALATADQSVINGAFRLELFPINDCWNTIWRIKKPPSPQALQVARVVHFMGSPKPWDLFGNRIHSGGDIFARYLDKTDIGRYQRIARGFGGYLRSMRLVRSYWKAIATRRSH